MSRLRLLLLWLGLVMLCFIAFVGTVLLYAVAIMLQTGTFFLLDKAIVLMKGGACIGLLCGTACFCCGLLSVNLNKRYKLLSWLKIVPIFSIGFIGAIIFFSYAAEILFLETDTIFPTFLSLDRMILLVKLGAGFGLFSGTMYLWANY
jgi:hypothetical protein